MISSFSTATKYPITLLGSKKGGSSVLIPNFYFVLRGKEFDVFFSGDLLAFQAI